MKQSNALAYLRQLCCSGLGKDIVIPEFLRAVRTVIPSNNNTFSGCDERLFPTYHIPGFNAAEMAEYIPEVISSFITPERQGRAAAWFRDHPVLTDGSVWDESFYRSDLYNLVYYPLEQHHVIFGPVRLEGKFAGMLGIFRPRQQKPFDSREQALLVQLLPYVAHALQRPDNENIFYSEHGPSGMMVMDTQGTILYLSPEAQQLLALACHPHLTVDVRMKKDALLAKLAQLCRNMEAIFRGDNAAPPSWRHTGPHGRFLFRAYWLDKQNREPGGLIGMTIEHQEPLVLKILRALQHLPLSPTQKEVASLLAQGVSSAVIGERLHIKLTTVKDHTGKIFTKLDIHHREELLPKLLTMDSSKSIIKTW